MSKIDVGCGRKPRPDYDVYTDVYMSDAVKNNPEIASKFVLTPMENMSMFKDKEFDFAFCHHVIEHTLNPIKACSELTRIAKEGVLYFPTPQIELTCGRYDHRWFVFKVASDHLLFIQRYFKPPYGSRAAIPNGAGSLLKLEQEPFYWKDSFKYSVIEVKQNGL